MEDFYNDYLQNSKELAGDGTGKASLTPTWEEMNKRLDKEMPKKRKTRFILWMFIVLFLMAAGWIFYDKPSTKASVNTANNFTTNVTSTQTNQSNSEKNEQTANTQKSTKSIAVNPLDREQKSVTDNASVNSPTHPILVLQTNKQVKDINKPFISPSHENNKNNNSFAALDRGDLKNKNPKQKAESYSPKNETKVHQVDIAKPLGNNVGMSDTTLKEFADYDKKKILETTTAKQVESDTATKQKSEVNIAKKVNKLNFKPVRWELVTTVAPDFLIANINTFRRPGIFAGAGVDYVLNNHFRIRTGLLFNHTLVNTTGEYFDYKYKTSGYLPANTKVELKDIKGYINSLELPLAVRYNINPKNKLEFNVSAGLSSIFFLNKNCDYELLLDGVTREHRNSQDDDENEEGESSKILNNLRIGFGVGFKVTRRISAEIEPSFRLPLEELGESHKRIGTLSVNFSLRLPLVK